MNTYTKALVQQLTERYSVETEGMTTGDWVARNTTHKGQPFSYRHYAFQKAIIDDLHPNMDVIKISQVGLSEIQMRKSMALCVRNPGIVGIFSLPNELMYRRFSQSRMQPIIDENKVFSGPADKSSVRSMALMQFGRSFLNIVNATEGSATSISADFVFNDEVDMCDGQTIALFASRLQNSDWKINQRFSTPTWVGYGIDGTYSVSDQREFMCRCNACRLWQIPMWDERSVIIPGLPNSVKLNDITRDILPKLRLDEALVICTACGAPLDLEDNKREWVATFPSRKDARGYRVRPFTSNRISIPYIVGQLQSYQMKNFIRGWHNTVLGEPYTASSARLDEASIKRCMGAPSVPETISDTRAPVFVGIDFGEICHVTLGTPGPNYTPSHPEIHVFSWRTIREHDLPNYIKEVEATYNLINGAADRHPYTPNANALRDQTANRIWPVEYRGTEDLKPVNNIEKITTHWQANRTKMIDAVADMVRQKLFLFSGYGLQAQVIIDHLQDMVRDEAPEKPATWIKLTGADHYFHSLAFLIIATKFSSIMDAISDIDHRSFIMFGGMSVGTTPNIVR